MDSIEFANVTVEMLVEGDRWLGVGGITIDGTPLRNASLPMQPWFDSFEGGPFTRFECVGVDRVGEGVAIRLHAFADMAYPFRERRDSSGDLCFTEYSWGRDAYQAEITMRFEPTEAEIDGRSFTGFKYWYEGSSAERPVHRFIDRQSWELGGNLDDVTICIRNWIAPPSCRVDRDTYYSTVGLEKYAGPMPGNLWGRWTQLPGFDMQHGSNGVLIGRFDEVSNIRCAIESMKGEDALRVQDLHLFEQTNDFTTSAKTILWCPDQLDATEALNLWTRCTDREADMSRAQFGIEADPMPRLVDGINVWCNYRFKSTYEEAVDTAAELGLDHVFIDVVWKTYQTMHEELEELKPEAERDGMALKLLRRGSMCCMIDWEVSEIHGGEAELKALCDRAAAKGVGIMSWLGISLGTYSDIGVHQKLELLGDSSKAFAVKESGSHPDTGYPLDLSSVNLNTPMYDYIVDSVLGVCERTGVTGWLMDSYSNLSWWQIDYGNGTMKPQFEKMAGIYSRLTNAGQYCMPEAIVAFSNHSSLHQFTGDMYDGDLLGYSYSTNIALPLLRDDELNGPKTEARMLTGDRSTELLFRVLSHRRAPITGFHHVPKETWDPEAKAVIKQLFTCYRQLRDRMQKRTVLHHDAGVVYTNDQDDQAILWAYHDLKVDMPLTDAFTGEAVADGQVQTMWVYTGAATDLMSLVGADAEMLSSLA